MSGLSVIVEELKNLPPDKLEKAATFIHDLHEVSKEAKKAALDDIFGWMSAEEADKYEKEIEESCERIDRKSW